MDSIKNKNHEIRQSYQFSFTNDEILVTHQMMVQASELALHYQSQKIDKPLLPLNKLSIHMAQTLFCTLINNYEINAILMFYMKLWERNRTDIEIRTVYLHSIISLRYHPFINEFFNQRNIIDHNSFFIFVCTFSVFTTVQIVPLLLSMCGVYSNLFITKDQVITFFQIYPYDKSCYKEFIECLHPTKYIKRDRYSLKDFIVAITSYTPTHNILESFRYEIVNKILTENIFFRIRSKIDYYYTTCDQVEKPQNPESCSDRLYRILCTTEPHPYFYNYYINNPTTADMEIILYEIKQKYGYGLRDRSKSQKSFTSSKSMKYNNYIQTNSNNGINNGKDINMINHNYYNQHNVSPTHHPPYLQPSVSCDEKYFLNDRVIENSRNSTDLIMNSFQHFEFEVNMMESRNSLSSSPSPDNNNNNTPLSQQQLPLNNNQHHHRHHQLQHEQLLEEDEYEEEREEEEEDDDEEDASPPITQQPQPPQPQPQPKLCRYSSTDKTKRSKSSDLLMMKNNFNISNISGSPMIQKASNKIYPVNSDEM